MSNLPFAHERKLAEQARKLYAAIQREYKKLMKTRKGRASYDFARLGALRTSTFNRWDRRVKAITKLYSQLPHVDL